MIFVVDWSVTGEALPCGCFPSFLLVALALLGRARRDCAIGVLGAILNWWWRGWRESLSDRIWWCSCRGDFRCWLDLYCILVVVVFDFILLTVIVDWVLSCSRHILWFLFFCFMYILSKGSRTGVARGGMIVCCLGRADVVWLSEIKITNY